MRFLVTLTLATLLESVSASAAPVRQELCKSSSQILFGVQSPNPMLKMNGSFKDFKGVFELHPSEITDSKLELTLNLGSATLPPDQLMQALFVQGIIARVAPTPNTFRSSRFEHKAGNSYLLHGTYTWMNKLKKISSPVTIREASLSRSRIELALEGSVNPPNSPRKVEGLAATAAGSEGWTKATLVFTP